MNETIPPLPDLAGRGSHLCDQDTIDRVLGIMYEQRPDLFKKIADREWSGLDSNDKARLEFYNFVRDEAGVSNSVVATTLFMEARRSARIMYGVPLAYSPALTPNS